MRTWRRLQQLGAVPVKQAVYVLPDTPAAREDFEWLKTEVKGAGGDASVFAADSVDTFSDDALVDEFRRARQDAYGALAREIERVLSRVNATRRPRGTRAPAVIAWSTGSATRLSALERIDFFGSAGRDRVVSLLAQLEDAGAARVSVQRAPHQRQARPTSRPTAGRLWVTRPRPGVDRMGSAWLIRRFVDAERAIRFRGRPRIAAGTRRNSVRHVRCRVQSPGRGLHVRDAVHRLRHRRSGRGAASPRSCTTST